MFLPGGMKIQEDWMLSQGSMGDPALVALRTGDVVTYLGKIYPALLGAHGVTVELLNRLK